MGFYDRQYYRDGQGGGRGSGIGPGMGSGTGMYLPRMTPVVKYLLIINIGVHVIQSFTEGQLESLFAASGSSTYVAIQVWRLITFQFLHAYPRHLFGNMLGLYFLGTILERSWGSKKFLKFYLISGMVGGLLFVIANRLGAFDVRPLVGASGGVLALLVACAILFPHIKILLFFILPVNIRLISVVVGLWYFFSVIQDYNNPASNAGGNLCHLGGMAVGFIWVMGIPYFAALKQKKTEGAYKRKLQHDQSMQYDVDRILAKVHEKGIQSLTKKEKQILQRATDQKRHDSR